MRQLPRQRPGEHKGDTRDVHPRGKPVQGDGQRDGIYVEAHLTNVIVLSI
jgi:hypothetical protein